ncbi:hypothetical protein R3P93_24340, partial [Rhodococcus cerastii]|nr:hypothetical protein [Rhodococcus cerastii]
ASGQFLSAVSGHIHGRLWSVFHGRRQQMREVTDRSQKATRKARRNRARRMHLTGAAACAPIPAIHPPVEPRADGGTATPVFSDIEEW